MYQTILVLLDGSKRAEKILPHVKQLAHAFNSKLVLLQIVPPVSIVTNPYDAHPDVIRQLQQELVGNITEYLQELCDQLSSEGINAELETKYGAVVESILQVAEMDQIDLIALASHGRTGLARTFYGSVADGVLHGVKTPILLIRAE